jgi:hypothetical protein
MLNQLLAELGWDASWEKALEPYKPQGFVPARKRGVIDRTTAY